MMTKEELNQEREISKIDGINVENLFMITRSTCQAIQTIFDYGLLDELGNADRTLYKWRMLDALMDIIDGGDCDEEEEDEINYYYTDDDEDDNDFLRI